MRDLRELDKYRQAHLEFDFFGRIGGATEGYFAVMSPHSKKKEFFRIIVSNGDDWEHVSVSMNTKRCPTWEEMEFIKRMFFAPNEVCMQLHVAESNHISFHPYTLHIWRPYMTAIPLPPA